MQKAVLKDRMVIATHKHIVRNKKKTVKVTLRSAASPCWAVSGNLSAIYISLGTLKRHSHYGHITHLIHMGTFNLHMGLSYDTGSVMCPVNGWWRTGKCSKVSCHGAPQN